MTGLTRKEVRSIREMLEKSGESSDSLNLLNPPSVVLHYWYTDPYFCERAGGPLALTLSDGSPSFSELCKKYVGDIPAGAIRAELKRAGVIEEIGGERIRPVARYTIPQALDEKFMRSMAFSMSNLTNTLLRNLAVSGDSLDGASLLEDGYFERYVWSTRLSDTDVVEFKRFAEQQGTELLAMLDSWIGEREQLRRQVEAGDDRYVGLGVYVFEKE